MVEVFKTNVEDSDHASWIIDCIGKRFSNYTANFDLEDCDNILRVKCMDAPIESQAIINLVHDSGYYAEILQDQVRHAKNWIVYSN